MSTTIEQLAEMARRIQNAIDELDHALSLDQPGRTHALVLGRENLYFVWGWLGPVVEYEP
jgi:hypothetical protein